MLRCRLIALVLPLATAVWLGMATRARVDDRVYANPDEADAETVLIQTLILELRLDAKRVSMDQINPDLESMGISFIGRTGRMRLDPEQLGRGPRDTIQILSRPQLRAILGQAQAAHVQVAGQQSVSYFVREGKDTFKLQKLDAKLGIEFSVTPEALEGDLDRIVLSNLKISTTTLDGREPIDGSDLDAGRPIISTRTLETSLTVGTNDGYVGFLLPAPSGRMPLLFFQVRKEPRIKVRSVRSTDGPAAPARGQPGRVEPQPRP
jgi:hypothetical protein